MPYTVKGKCVYKKDTGKKGGCTDGDVNDYLAALHANTNESLLEEVDKLLLEQPQEVDPRILAYLKDLSGFVKNLTNQINEMQKGPQGLEAMRETLSHYTKRIHQLETGEKQFPDIQSEFPGSPGYIAPGGSLEEDILEYNSKVDSYGNLVFELKRDE